MKQSRIEQLLEFLKEDTVDSFTIYGLALEYEKHDTAKAKLFYDLLLKDHSRYLATYYHAGKWYEKIEVEVSKSIYKKGMKLAKELGQQRTYNELQNALNLVEDEDY